MLSLVFGEIVRNMNNDFVKVLRNTGILLFPGTMIR